MNNTSLTSDISHSHVSPLHAVRNAITLLESALASPRYEVQGDSILYSEMRRDLPYNVHDTKLPYTQILVNRDYQPLGYSGIGQAKYKEYTNLHVNLTPAEIASITIPDPHQPRMFGDSNPPWMNRECAVEYLKRLRKLRDLLCAQ